MKQRTNYQQGLIKPVGFKEITKFGKDLVRNPKETFKETGRKGLERLKEELMQTHDVHVEDDIKNPSTKTIDKSEVHINQDSRNRIPNLLKGAWGSLPNTDKVNKNPPVFFKADLGGKTANKESVISKMNQQFAKLGLRITELFGGENAVKSLTDVMESVFGMTESAIPDKYQETAEAIKNFVVGLMNHMAKSSNMVAIIKAYRLSMMELYLKTMNYLYDHKPEKYQELYDLDKSWLDLWGLSTGAFTDIDTVYKYLNNNDEHIKEFVAAIAYSEAIQDILFGDSPNDMTAKKWRDAFTNETIAEVKEAVKDGTLTLTKKEEKSINKGKWPYLAEQI